MSTRERDSRAPVIRLDSNNTVISTIDWLNSKTGSGEPNNKTTLGFHRLEGDPAVIRIEEQAIGTLRPGGTASQPINDQLLIRYEQPFYKGAKRLIDITISAAGLLVLSPVFALIAALIFGTEGGPVVFRQRRLGQNGKVFYILKFRTMVRNAEEILRAHPELMEQYERYYKIDHDPRISRLGRILRKTSMDELPQLWNVLKGEMALVGPRPIVEPEISKYGESGDLYKAMKPGCAGLWQCRRRDETSYDERVAMDREYYHRASLRFDMSIVFQTLVAICAGRGAR